MSTPMLAMVVLGAVCWVFRILFIALVPAGRLPQRVRDALTHLAPAVMAALVAVELTGMTSSSDAGTSVLVLLVAAAVAVAVRLTGSLALAIGLASVSVLLLDLVVLS